MDNITKQEVIYSKDGRKKETERLITWLKSVSATNPCVDEFVDFIQCIMESHEMLVAEKRGYRAFWAYIEMLTGEDVNLVKNGEEIPYDEIYNSAVEAFNEAENEEEE